MSSSSNGTAKIHHPKSKIPMPIPVAHSCYRWLPLTEGWIYRQIQHLPPDQIEPHIICERVENQETFPWPNLHAPSPRHWRYTLDKIWRKLGWQHHLTHTAQTIRRYQFPLVHSHFGNKGWLDLGAIQGTATKQIVTFYGLDASKLPQQHPIWRTRYQQLFAQAAQILCEGHFMRQRLLQLGADPARTRVQHLGVEVDQIRFEPRYRQPDEPLKVLMAASFTEKKGFPDGLEALGRLHHEHHIPLQITIIGDARPEPQFQGEKQKILAAIAKWKLEPLTRLLGYQPYANLFAEAYQHHLFLSPSRTASDGDAEGGAPVSLIDMQATGMPIISTTHCDIPEVVQHGRTGLLSPEGDIDSLVHNLHRLAQNPDQWAEIGTAGRQHIEQEYNAQIQGQRLAAIYQELV